MPSSSTSPADFPLSSWTRPPFPDTDGLSSCSTDSFSSDKTRQPPPYTISPHRQICKTAPPFLSSVSLSAYPSRDSRTWPPGTQPLPHTARIPWRYSLYCLTLTDTAYNTSMPFPAYASSRTALPLSHKTPEDARNLPHSGPTPGLFSISATPLHTDLTSPDIPHNRDMPLPHLP